MRRILFTVTLAAGLTAGCTVYGPGRLAPGATLDDSVKAMGIPTARSPLPDGGERLEYARGPFGRHTYMLRFDRGGRLVASEQVLTEAHFNTIQAGMSAEEVIARIGHSTEHRVVGWARRQTVWAYRYETPFCQWFQVGLDEQGKVIDTSYGPDPMCDRRDAGDSL